MSGHAACTVGAKIYLFGGRQGSQVRKYLRRLYIYDTGAVCRPVLRMPCKDLQRGFTEEHGARDRLWLLCDQFSGLSYTGRKCVSPFSFPDKVCRKSGEGHLIAQVSCV